jgi:hypothetical protein
MGINNKQYRKDISPLHHRWSGKRQKNTKSSYIEFDPLSLLLTLRRVDPQAIDFPVSLSKSGWVVVDI